MAKIYYIDSENVGDSWIELLEDEEAKVLVFYTGHSPRIAYSSAIKLLNAAIKPEFIECHEGNNGLDFQLVTYLGYELHADSTNEIIIVSNDTGFDVVVLFWRERGMDVSRNPAPNISKANPIGKYMPDEVEAVSPASVTVAEELCGVNINELNTIISCIGKSNSSYIHMALVHFYGNKSGEEIYKELKKKEFAAPAVNWSKETRMVKIINLIILYVNTANVAIPDSLSSYLAANIVGDKKTMGDRLRKQYPKNGTQLNKLFKPFYKMLAKIKK